jgi:hypothetical protein
LFKQIHEIVFNSNGGYDWETVYHMPLWLRRTTWNLMQAHYDAQKAANENQQNMLSNSNKSQGVAKPNITTTPNYTVKAPKK